MGWLCSKRCTKASGIARIEWLPREAPRQPGPVRSGYRPRRQTNAPDGSTPEARSRSGCTQAAGCAIYSYTNIAAQRQLRLTAQILAVARLPNRWRTVRQLRKRAASLSVAAAGGGNRQGRSLPNSSGTVDIPVSLSQHVSWCWVRLQD